jgi:hypothetical protein
VISAPGFPQFFEPPIAIFLAVNVVFALAARSLAFFASSVRHAAPSRSSSANGRAASTST